MRLLPFSLTLLFIAYPSLGAPATPNDSAPAKEDPAPTTIETIYETVTRTVIHEVTEPTVTEPTVAKKPCACKEGVTTNGEDTVAETADVPVDTVPAADSAVNSVPEVTTVEVTEHTRMCTCTEKDACRKESMETMNVCMKECESNIKDYGDKTDDYLDCFKKNNVSIIQAEDCLFKDVECNNATEAKTVAEPTKWDTISDIKYAENTTSQISANVMWKRDGKKYNKIQDFFHCTKNCMHKKVKECTATKECTMKMPAHDEFADKMRTCVQKDVKIAQSIFSACQCLAWKKDVKELRGSCVVIGNSFYIDRT